MNSTTPWLTCLTRTPSPTINLICFPFGGAGASAYRPLAAQLPPGVALWSVQLPGRENRFAEPFAQNADAVVQAISADIDRLGSQPLVLFGHSMGSDLAVLCAMWRQQQEKPPLRGLVVSGNKPPHLPLERRWAGVPEADLIRHVLDLGGMPPEALADREFASIYLDKLRADYRLYEGIGTRAAQSLDTPLWVIHADADPLLAGVDVNEWRHYSSRPPRLCPVRGGHFYFLPDTSALAAVLTDAVA